MDLTPETLNRHIKSLAAAQGFCACGITRAEPLAQDRGFLEKWLADGRQGEMGYLERHLEKRLDPRLLADHVKTIICLAHSYYTPTSPSVSASTGFAKYALGQDYHRILKDKMHTLCAALQTHTGPFPYRVFTDSAPVPERRLAQRAGLGWIGKSSMFIIPRAGSYLFLSEIFTPLDIAPDEPFTAHKCGACRRCQMACPTGAIDGSGAIDARKCLSYLTIEYKGNIPPEASGKLGHRVYGCDTCLDVCPWNKAPAATGEPAFQPLPTLARLRPQDWSQMDAETFQEQFSASPILRAGLDKIQRTAALVKNNLADNGF